MRGTGIFQPKGPEALDLEQALAQEYAGVTGEPEPAPGATVGDIQKLHFAKQTAALCFSGGGIRSAAFALGVAQGLAKRGLLKRFHYLSTVSGGGYTGSFLAAWAYRAEGGIAEVERELAAPRPEPAKPSNEPDPLRWVRRYSSYLAPRTGLTSLDSWTLIVTYLRNLALNWLVLVPLLAAVVCVPFFARALITAPWWGDYVAIERLGIALTVAGLFILRWRTYSTGSVGVQRRRVRFDRVVLPLLFCGAVVMAIGHHAFAISKGGLFKGFGLLEVAADVVFAAGGLGILFILLDLPRARVRPWRDRVILFVAFAVSALLSGYAVTFWQDFFPWERTLDNQAGRGLALALLGPPAWLVLLLLPEVLFLAMAGSLADDHDREWWARNVAFVVRTCLGWIAGGVLVLLGPRLLDFLVVESQNADLPALVASVATLLGGLLARRFFVREASGSAGDPLQGAARRRRAELVLNAGGILLIAAILAGFAYYIERVLHWFESRHGRAWLGDWSIPFVDLEFSFAWAGRPALVEFLLAAVLLAASAIIGVAVHVNRYSLHAMYRDRLIRTFLAATRWRRVVPTAILAAMGSVTPPVAGWLRQRLDRLLARGSEPPPEVWQFTGRQADPFTDFDRHDNPLMQWLAPERRGGSGLFGFATGDGAQALVRAPMLVVNCALNMVGERDTAVQERKAASFTFTPLHAGCARTGYRPVAGYGGPDGITLGTALTISGAAVSPNAGQRSSPATTFLMTLFNARLGWWLGNPESAVASTETGPTQSLAPLGRELLGRTHSAGRWIYLSDGGHFENLALYEMVRRGCRYIVVSDASADPDRSFDDLGNAIRKIRIDLGIEIRQNEVFQIGGRDLAEHGRYAAPFDIDQITEVLEFHCLIITQQKFMVGMEACQCYNKNSYD